MKYLASLYRGAATLLVVGVLSAVGLIVAVLDFSDDPDLDLFIEKKMRALHARGMAVGFIEDGRVTRSLNYGNADPESSQEVDGDTIFPVASVSKLVTGVAVMQLHEQGLIALDQPIDEILPFQIVNPNFPDSAITPRMLLQHRSSLIDHEPTYRALFSGLGGGSASTVDPSLEVLVRAYYLPTGDLYDARRNFAAYAPGAERRYSNVAFALLGYVVEHVSGRTFDRYCKEFIFDPLGMNSTGWFPAQVDVDRLAVLYDGDARLERYGVASYPDGGLMTNVRDFSKFFIAMMNAGSEGHARVLKSSSVEEMFGARPEDNLAWEPDVLGEFWIDNGGALIVGHSGGDPGVSSLALFDRESGRGLLVFANGGPSLISPTPVSMLETLNYRSLYRRLAIEAGLLEGEV